MSVVRKIETLSKEKKTLIHELKMLNPNTNAKNLCTLENNTTYHFCQCFSLKLSINLQS